MPSSKSPLALQVGPGQLPANTIGVAAFTSAAGPVTPTSEEMTVVDLTSVSTGITQLSRSSANMIVLLNNGTGLAFTIRLPTAAVLGDVVTFAGTTSGLANIIIDAGSTPIHGFATPDEHFGGPFAARSFTLTGTGWASLIEKPGVQVVTGSTTLLRAGPAQLVLADASAGPVIVFLPQRAQIGDRITVIKSVATSNTVQVVGNGGDTIDGRVSTNLFSSSQLLTVVRIAAGSWLTLSESSSVVVVTDTINLSADTAKEIHVLVRTNDAAWIAGTKTITLPDSLIQVGSRLTITDVDGFAGSRPIVVPSLVLGVSNVTSSTGYTIASNYGSATLVSRGGAWAIQAETSGLVDNFASLSRVDAHSEAAVGRLLPTPMFNWSHRKVALHAEFNGLISNFFPVEGFTPGGTMKLSAAPSPGSTGTVGVVRCTTTAGTAGWMHLGNLPTQAMFDPAQMQGFRVILTPVTANPGTGYAILVGFGDDISDTTGTIFNKLGTNGLYLLAETSGVWLGDRQAGGSSATPTTVPVVANNRYVLEYYFSGSTWDIIVNGVRFPGVAANVPTAKMNFGLMLFNTGGGSDYVVDVDSITIFSSDMGATRHSP